MLEGLKRKEGRGLAESFHAKTADRGGLNSNRPPHGANAEFHAGTHGGKGNLGWMGSLIFQV